MALTVRQTTSNTTPDAAQGGVAVTGATNTGHASTIAAVVGAGSQTKSCIWTGFAAAPGGTITSVTLKVDFTRTGALSDGGAGTSNQFRLQYSTNSGGAWTSLRDDTQVETSLSGTSSVALSTSQNLTTVQVRDLLVAGGVPGEIASVTATVSGIRIEVVTVDALGRAVVAVM